MITMIYVIHVQSRPAIVNVEQFMNNTDCFRDYSNVITGGFNQVDNQSDAANDAIEHQAHCKFLTVSSSLRD